MAVSDAFRISRWPRLIRLEQLIKTPPAVDIAAKVREGFCRHAGRTDFAGKRIAVAVGSRGVHAIDQITREVVNNLRQMGASPFIIPAMGSHGGATAAGQLSTLAHLGISEHTMGVPVISDLDVELLETLPGEIPVYVSKTALKADGVVAINRIKMHTSFRGDYESGLLKMLVVGMGNHKGALTFHEMGFEDMAKNLVDMARPILKRFDILFGVGAVENAFDETTEIAVLAGDEILREEPRLLKLSKVLMPRIPFEKIDILVMKQVGKDISGDGMDPNITGRYTPSLTPDYASLPMIRRIVAFDLTEASDGSAIGMGHLDVITQKFRDKINFETTYMNAISATVTNTCKMPIVMPDERSALEVAYRTTQVRHIDDLTMCILEDTLHLNNMVVSEALYQKEVAGCPVKYGDEFFDLTFDAENQLSGQAAVWQSDKFV